MPYPKKYHVRQVRTDNGWSIVNEQTGVRVRIYNRARGKCDMFVPGEDVQFFDSVKEAKHAAYLVVDGVPVDVAKRERRKRSQWG